MLFHSIRSALPYNFLYYGGCQQVWKFGRTRLQIIFVSSPPPPPPHRNRKPKAIFIASSGYGPDKGTGASHTLCQSRKLWCQRLREYRAFSAPPSSSLEYNTTFCAISNTKQLLFLIQLA